MLELSETIERKFIESKNIEDYEIWTDSGWQNISSIHKTIEYEVYRLDLEDGLYLECADNHIVFNQFNEQIFVKDLIPEIDLVQTEFGLKKVISFKNLNYSENMYDITVDSEDHTYYTNNILSHNTTCVAATILWYILFNEHYSVAILANKQDQAYEIMSRVQLAFEHLPKWLQQGVKVWNAGDIELENGSKVLASSTSGSAIRGRSCVTDDTKVTISINNDIYFGEIALFINIIKEYNNSIYKQSFTNMINKLNKKYLFLYKTTNKINNKIYIGIHGTDNINDGYLGSGKLLKKAIEKYGINNFEREILEFASSYEELAKLEEKYVNEDYLKQENVYNLTLGGFIKPPEFGEKNHFFGKKHSEKTKEKIGQFHKNNEHNPNYIFVIDKILNGYKKAYDYYKNKTSKELPKTYRNFIITLCGNPEINDVYMINQIKQYNAEKYYENMLIKKEKNKIILSENAKNRFLNVNKTEEHKQKISNSHKKINHYWISEKINKNPDKIKKTAEKHRRMKRSKETKEKISLSKKGKIPNNIGKKSFYNKDTLEIKYFDENFKSNVWILGRKPKNVTNINQ